MHGVLRATFQCFKYIPPLHMFKVYFSGTIIRHICHRYFIVRFDNNEKGDGLIACQEVVQEGLSYMTNA